MQPFPKWRLALCGALLVSCAVLLAACGGSSGTSSSSSSGGSEATTASSESGSGDIAGIPAPVTEPPTEFPIKMALKETPKPQNLTWLACSLPICQEALSEGYHEAAEALAWPIKQINYDTLKAAEAVQTALNENPMPATNTDHHATAHASVKRAPFRSDIQPPGIWKRVYDQLNAERHQPQVIRSMWKSLLMLGVTAPMTARSMYIR